MAEIEPLTKMTELRNKYLLAKNLKEPKCKTSKQLEKVQKEIAKLEMKFDKKVEDLKQIKYNLENGEIEDFDREDPNVRFAYIVFRSMDAIKHLENAYNKSASSKFFTRICKCLCKKSWKDFKSKHFFKKWPEWSIACQPDEIMWSNASTSDKSRIKRKRCVLFLVLLMFVVNFITIMYVYGLIAENEQAFNLSVTCPSEVSKAEAHKDYTESAVTGEDSFGFMNCFCKKNT